MCLMLQNVCLHIKHALLACDVGLGNLCANPMPAPTIYTKIGWPDRQMVIDHFDHQRGAVMWSSGRESNWAVELNSIQRGNIGHLYNKYQLVLI